MKRGALLAVLAVGSVLIATALGWRSMVLPRAAVHPRAAPEGSRAPEPPAIQPTPPRQHSRTWAEGSAVPVPRPTARGPAEVRDARVPDEAWPDHQPPPPGGDVREEDVHEVVMGQVIRPLRECIDDWMTLDPALEGRVVLGITLGPGGLEQVEILDHSEVPPGPLSCFASAVWEAGWPASDEPVEITYPFIFSSGGEGPPTHTH